MVQVHSYSDLLETLRQWHRASSPERPASFPGPLAGKEILTAWLDDVSARAGMRNISRRQWANATLAWIPAAPEGKSGFKEQLLKLLREENVTQQSGNVRFWEWEFFKHRFFHLCEKEVIKYYAKIGATAVGSAIALPIIGLPLLGVIGFTPAGVAGGSIAAGLQSAIYGGATGGVFSILQSVAARAALPAAWNVTAAVLGGATAAYRDQGSSIDHDIESFLGDIGDFPQFVTSR